MLKATEQLVWSTQPFDASDTDHRQTMYKTIPKIPKELRALLLSLHNDPGGMDEAISLIEETHFRLLRNNPPPFKTFEPIPVGHSSATTRVSAQLLSEVAGLQCNQWFSVKVDDGSLLRARLALKQDQFQQLLFVNRSGIKYLQKSFEEFAFLLSSGTARELQPTAAFTNSLFQAAGMKPGDAIPTASTESHTDIETPPEPDIEQQQKFEAKEVDQNEAGWLVPPETDIEETSASQSEPEPVKNTVPISQAESDPIAEPEPEPRTIAESEPADDPAPELVPAPAPETIFDAEPIQANRADRATPIEQASPGGSTKASVKATPSDHSDEFEISIGSWVKFSDTDSEQLCKLAARIDSIDRLLFVNERGVKQRELNHATIKALLDAGLCEVVPGGPRFQQTVSEMVRNFRSVDIDEDGV